MILYRISTVCTVQTHVERLLWYNYAGVRGIPQSAFLIPTMPSILVCLFNPIYSECIPSLVVENAHCMLSLRARTASQGTPDLLQASPPECIIFFDFSQRQQFPAGLKSSHSSEVI